MSKASRLYWAFVLAVLIVLALATIPIAASDLFREPYSPIWPIIHRTMARFRLTYNPSGGGAPPQYPYWHDPADAYLYYRDLKLTTADGLDLAAWYVPVSEPGAPAPTVLLCHGFLDSKWSMLRLVPWLHDAGYNVLLLDFRGHGESDHKPTTFGPEEVLDVQAALNWLEAEGMGDRIAGLGMSLGAAALVNTAIEDERLDALVLDSLFADWGSTNFAEGYRLPPDWLVPDVPSPVELMPRVHVPVLIIHGTADILTHVEHAHRLYAAANEPKTLWINDSGHAWSAWTYPDLYQKHVLDFLDAAFPGSQVIGKDNCKVMRTTCILRRICLELLRDRCALGNHETEALGGYGTRRNSAQSPGDARRGVDRRTTQKPAACDLIITHTTIILVLSKRYTRPPYRRDRSFRMTSIPPPRSNPREILGRRSSFFLDPGTTGKNQPKDNPPIPPLLIALCPFMSTCTHHLHSEAFSDTTRTTPTSIPTSMQASHSLRSTVFAANT